MGTSERIILRPLGNPLPLGFLGLAVATAVVAAYNLDWLPSAEQHQVALVLMAFAFPLQGLGSIFCFLARDAPAGTGFGVQAVAWLTLGLLFLSGPPGGRSATVAAFLFMAAAAIVPPAASVGLSKIVPALVMTGTAARFFLTGLYEQFGAVGWAKAAGWEGVVLAGLALYAALAVDVSAALRRNLLPIGRHDRGITALRETPSEQSAELEREPGAREQL